MKPRHPPPHLWLMTDERQGKALWTALARLPRGGGIVFRHYATPLPARRAVYERVRAIARRRRLVLVLAGPPAQAIAWRADGAHGPSPHRHTPRDLLRTAPAHGPREIAGARHVDLVFVSPVFATRSHIDAAGIGPLRFAALVRLARRPVIALGGMDAAKARRIRSYGWAAIDAWAGRSSGQPIRI